MKTENPFTAWSSLVSPVSVSGLGYIGKLAAPTKLMPQGKSLFVPYAHGLALQLGIPTLYCPSPEFYWIADDNGFREVFMNGHQSYYPTRDMLIFVDTIKPPEQLSSLGLNEGFLVQVTSPEDSEDGRIVRRSEMPMHGS